MKVYVVANLKGGVGKTTTTVNVAYTFSEMGGRVLVIDLDPQCNCTRFFAKVNGYRLWCLLYMSVFIGLQNIRRSVLQLS